MKPEHPGRGYGATIREVFQEGKSNQFFKMGMTGFVLQCNQAYANDFNDCKLSILHVLSESISEVSCWRERGKLDRAKTALSPSKDLRECPISSVLHL